MVLETAFDVLNIEFAYTDELDEDSDYYTEYLPFPLDVIVEHDKDKHFSSPKMPLGLNLNHTSLIGMVSLLKSWILPLFTQEQKTH